jgi:hypothetical protein
MEETGVSEENQPIFSFDLLTHTITTFPGVSIFALINRYFICIFTFSFALVHLSSTSAHVIAAQINANFCIITLLVVYLF